MIFDLDGVISQFEGYATLEEFDWDGYGKKYGDIHRLDRLLEAEGDDVNRYEAAKQADVLMLFYLFSAEELQALESDIADIQGGTTSEVMHLGAMAGTVDLLQRGYTGIVTRDLLEVHSRASNASPIDCRVANEERTLQAGETHGFPIDAGTRGRRDPTADA